LQTCAHVALVEVPLHVPWAASGDVPVGSVVHVPVVFAHD
jgi:hypothetical protein